MHSKCINFTSSRKSVIGNEFSDIRFPTWCGKFCHSMLLSSILAILTAHVQFQPYYYFQFKIWHHIWLQHTHCVIKPQSFRARDTIFSVLCYDNVCACAVSTLLVLLVVNFSPKQQLFRLTQGMLHSSKCCCLWKKPVVGWHWWLWKEPVVMCGNWNVGQATLQHEWPPSARIHASSLFCHWSTVSSTTLC